MTEAVAYGESKGAKGFSLPDLGWRTPFDHHYEPYRDRYHPGRVAIEQRGLYTVYCEAGEVTATVAGKFMAEATVRADYPAVGDWVLLSQPNQDRRAVIHGILPRISKFGRKMAGRVSEEQIVAANIDVVFICMGLDENFNIRRLERYLAAGWESGAWPVIVLTKADLADDLDEKVCRAESAAVGADVVPVSSLTGVGLDRFRSFLSGAKTGALLGSSGVGKSTLVNYLLGWERQATGEVRQSDGRGRHTTTHRELILLPGGGVLVDTPGMRELQLMEAGHGVEGAFEDIEALAGNCRFNDCRHENEPGCAVREAVAAGVLEEGRLVSYAKLQREQAQAERRAALRLARMQKTRRKEPARGGRMQPDLE